MTRYLNFFSWTSNKTIPRRNFFCQSNYALELVDKFGFLGSKDVKVSMTPSYKLDKDKDGKPVDQKLY